MKRIQFDRQKLLEDIANGDKYAFHLVHCMIDLFELELESVESVRKVILEYGQTGTEAIDKYKVKE